MRLIVILTLVSFASAFQSQPSFKLPAQRLASSGSPEGGPEVSPNGRENSGRRTSKRTVGRVSLPFTRKVLENTELNREVNKDAVRAWLGVLLVPLLLLSPLFNDNDGATYYYSSSSVSITSVHNPDGTISRNIDRSSKVKTNVNQEALRAKPLRLMGDSIFLDVTNDFN